MNIDSYLPLFTVQIIVKIPLKYRTKCINIVFRIYIYIKRAFKEMLEKKHYIFKHILKSIVLK